MLLVHKTAAVAFGRTVARHASDQKAELMIELADQGILKSDPSVKARPTRLLPRGKPQL